MAVNETVAWQDRKVREGVEHIDQLLFHPNNPKVHPIRQTNAVKAAIRELGWMAKVKINLRTSDQWPNGERGVEVVIDGHDRIKAAAQDGQDTVPAEYYDLTPNEESLFLLTYDPIGTMFARDRETTERLMQEVQTGEAELMTFLGQEAEGLGIVAVAAESWENAFSKLPDQDRAPFQQMTFTLHDSQAASIKHALSISKNMGEFDSQNENSNGNALARICEAFVADYGNG